MNVNAFDLNLLRVFAAMDRERNVSRAAAVVGLSQPAMSNALSRLRRACDDQLFIRTSNGMEPTPLARKMAGPVMDALTQVERALSVRQGFNPRTARATFRLLMTDVSQMAILPPLIDHVMAEAPGITIEVLQVPRERYAEALHVGEVDLAIGHISTARSGLYQRHLFDDTYCCVAALNHPTLKGSIDLPAFLDASHLTVATGNAEQLVRQALSGEGHSLKVVLRLPQYHTAIAVVRATRLIATIPRLALRNLTGVQVLDLPIELPAAEVRQFWHARNHTDAAHKWLREQVVRLTSPAEIDAPGQGRRR